MKKYLLVWAICTAILYGCISFFYLNADPHVWSGFARGTACVLPGFILGIIAVARTLDPGSFDEK